MSVSNEENLVMGLDSAAVISLFTSFVDGLDRLDRFLMLPCRAVHCMIEMLTLAITKWVGQESMFAASSACRILLAAIIVVSKCLTFETPQEIWNVGIYINVDADSCYRLGQN